jgi:ABC-type sugar transport system permease subunit
LCLPNGTPTNKVMYKTAAAAAVVLVLVVLVVVLIFLVICNSKVALCLPCGGVKV